MVHAAVHRGAALPRVRRQRRTRTRRHSGTPFRMNSSSTVTTALDFRNRARSSFRLREPEIDARDVGRLLGVRYCLTGSIEASARGRWAWRGAGRHPRTAASSGRSATRLRATTCTTSDGDFVRRSLPRSSCASPCHEASLARLGATESLDAWSAFHVGLQHVYRFNRADTALARTCSSIAVAREPTLRACARGPVIRALPGPRSSGRRTTSRAPRLWPGNAPSVRSNSTRSTLSSTSRWATHVLADG
jgi:hypothetical protein